MTIRAPHFSEKRPRKVQPPQLIANLLVTVLAVPFAQHAWPNPHLQETQQPFQVGVPLTILEDAGEKPFVQSEWPNPGPIKIQTPFQVGTPLTILEDAGDKPFAQADWPNPGPIKIQPPFQVGMALTILADAGEKPFAQTSWPNPTVAIKVQTPFQTVSVLEDPGEKPFNLSDWPNPQLEITKQPDLLPAPGVLLAAPAPAVTIFRAPHLSAKQPFAVQQPFHGGAPLSILVDAGAKPFAKTDWPNPEPRVVQQPLDHPAPLVLLVAVVDPPPIAQHDWPNPQLQEARQPFQVGTSLTILADAGEKPATPYEWPNPLPHPTQQPFQVGSPLTLMVLTGPFFQSWVNPDPDDPTQQPFQIGSALTILTSAGAKPFVQSEWPNPAPRVVEQRQDIQISLSVATAVPDDPFFQTDWPNPTVDRQVQTPFQVGSPLALIEGAGEKPFVQTDWIRPGPIVVQQPEAQGRPSFLVEGPPPVFQHDWPNPTVLIKVQQPFQVGMALSIFDTAGEKPFLQSEWPNPGPIKIQTPDYPGKSIASLEAPVVTAVAFTGRHITPTWSGRAASSATAATRITSTYTILATDAIVFANTDGAAFTVTLPAGVAGRPLIIINSGSSGNDLTVAPAGTEHLFGSNTNFTLRDGESLEIRWNATDGWY